MERVLRDAVAGRWFTPVGLLLFSQWEIWVAGQTHPVGPLGVTAATVAAAAVSLLWRREAPLVVQLGSVAVTLWLWLVWGSPQNGALFLIGMAATYSVGRWGRRPAAFLGIPVVVGWAFCQLALDPLQSSLSAGWGWALWGVGAWLAGAWVRQRAELASHQATERETAARAQLAEQRLDIARDLHDVLANSLGVIVVHAEAAEALLATDAQRATEAMRRVQSTGREALREVRGVLGSLREKVDEEQPALVERGHPEHQDATPTTPNLDDVGSLVLRMQHAGLPWSFDAKGTIRFRQRSAEPLIASSRRPCPMSSATPVWYRPRHASESATTPSRWKSRMRPPHSRTKTDLPISPPETACVAWKNDFTPWAGRSTFHVPPRADSESERSSR